MFHEDIPTVNILKLNFWLVISIAKNFIWTTLKMIFSIFRFFCTLRLLFINLSDDAWISLSLNWPLMTGFVLQGHRYASLLYYMSVCGESEPVSIISLSVGMDFITSRFSAVFKELKDRNRSESVMNESRDTCLSVKLTSRWSRCTDPDRAEPLRPAESRQTSEPDKHTLTDHSKQWTNQKTLEAGQVLPASVYNNRFYLKATWRRRSSLWPCRHYITLLQAIITICFCLERKTHWIYLETFTLWTIPESAHLTRAFWHWHWLNGQ